MSTNIKMAVFRSVPPCSLVGTTDVSKVLTTSINRVISHHPDDGGSTHF